MGFVHNILFLIRIHFFVSEILIGFENGEHFNT